MFWDTNGFAIYLYYRKCQEFSLFSFFWSQGQLNQNVIFNVIFRGN